MSAGLLATRMPARLEGRDLVLRLARAARDDRAGVAHSLPRRGSLAGDESRHRLGKFARCLELRGLLFGIAADLAHHQHGVRVRVRLKERECVDEARPVDRVAADAHARALADAEVGELPHALVRQRARSADHANPPRLVNVTRHDADLAGPRRDDARAVRPDQPEPRDGVPSDTRRPSPCRPPECPR